VAAPADIQKQVDAARKADRKNVLMLIQREGGVQYVPLSITKSPDGKDKQPG
jgi:serine protease Do